MTLLIITLLGVTAMGLWVVGVRLWYHLNDRPLLLRAPTSDGWLLSVWYRAPQRRRFKEPVVLCHGLGNNHAFFEFRGTAHLASVLARAGFDVFSMDCRGAGRSRPKDPAFTEASIDDSIEFDVSAVLDLVERQTNQRRVMWVGHSLGGIIGTLAAPRCARGRFAGIVTIGSPFFFEPSPFFLRALRAAQLLSPAGRFPARVLMTMIAPFGGLMPAPRVARIAARVSNIDGREQRHLLANVFADLWRGVLAQLERWVANDEMTSNAGEDLRTPALAVPVPRLVIGGTADHLAPVASVRRFFDALSVEPKTLLLVGRVHGHSEDYGHGDLVLGRHAHIDVYPAIVRFLESVGQAEPFAQQEVAREGAASTSSSSERRRSERRRSEPAQTRSARG
jgi:pimeloyl-ACP methyl ester carboxylesterase